MARLLNNELCRGINAHKNKSYMKRIISILAIGCSIISCNNDSGQAAALQAKITVDSMNNEMVKQKAIDSMNSMAAQQQSQPAQSSTESHGVAPGHHYRDHHYSNNGNGNNNDNNGYNDPNGPAFPNQPPPVPVAVAVVPAPVIPPPPRKKGWSDKAKGAVIGMGAGAITGALLDKNKGAGALIGGVAGGAAGLGAGAILDKKNKEDGQ